MVNSIIAFLILLLNIVPLMLTTKRAKSVAYQWWHMPWLAFLFVVVAYYVFRQIDVTVWPVFRLLFDNAQVEAAYVLLCQAVWLLVGAALRRPAVHKVLLPWFQQLFGGQGEDRDHVLPFPYFIDHEKVVRSRVGKPFYQQLLGAVIVIIAVAYALFFLLVELVGISFWPLSAFGLFALLPLADYYHYLKAEVHPAVVTEDSGIHAGFTGPMGLPEGTTVVYDSSLKGIEWLATGACEEDKHYIGFNIARDIGEVEYVDVAKAFDGGICPVCGKPSIYTSRGIEVGNIFQLGTKYTESMDMTYVDQDGSLKHPIMGCYGIGVGRLAASVCEAHHDDYGPVWPMSIAPWHVQICSLRADQPEVIEMSQKLYDALTARGVEVLWDDRSVSAGVMFSDADLFGVPLRVVVSPKGLQNGTIEIATRDKSMKELVPVNEAEDFVVRFVEDALAKLECKL